MSFIKIPMNPGVYVDDTPLSARGSYVSANKIRFVRGVPQTFGGWEYVTTTALTGICRGLHAWADLTGVKHIAAGTHRQLAAITDGTYYDITPIIERGQLSNPFSTTISSTSVSVSDTAHGLVANQKVTFANTSAVGGLTISGSYYVTSITDANTYVITASSAATSTAGPGGGTVDYAYSLAPGNENGTAGLGYSAGTYSSGTYSGTSTGDFFPRTWSMQNWGQNGLFCPRKGGIYEWAPLLSSSELVTNGSFTGSATGWTLGTGWAYSANNVVATSCSSSLTQSITLNPAAYFEVEFTVSAYAAGSMTVTLAGNAVGAAITANGVYKRQVYGGATAGAQNLTFQGSNASLTLDSVSVTQELTAEIVPNAPTQNACMIVTAEKFVMVGGTIEAATSRFNAMHIRWSDIANNQTWTPASTNLSSFYTLGEGSRIVGMRNGNGEILVWTDSALYAGTYSSDVGIVYSFRLVGKGCGLIGPNAATVAGGVAYWMSPSGEVFAYSGGAPILIKSTMIKDMMDNLAFIQQDKIYCEKVSQFQNIIWLYPDMRDGAECSRYALLCTAESAPNNQGQGGVGVWAPGTFDRTAWLDNGVTEYPVAVDASGYVYYQEKGSTANGGSIDWSLETGALEIGNGDTLFGVRSFLPDFKTITGGATLTVTSYKYAQSTGVDHGPYNVSSASEKVDLMADAPVGRQVQFLIEGSSSPAEMRSGQLTADIYDTGMAF